jgi:hypothetical protein
MDEECRYCGKRFQDLETVMRHQETNCPERKTAAKAVWMSLLREKNNGGLPDAQFRSRRDRTAKKPSRRYTRTAYSSIT